jgi:CDP-glucose 4,6-dehydratase
LGAEVKSLSGKRVLLTGHTGFKGSWALRWLERLGAEVTGYALEAPSNPAHFLLLNSKSRSVIGDVRDGEKLTKVVAEVRPELVIHMAAQPLVRRSYQDPIETYDVNVMGTLKLFEACRAAGSVRAIVNVTSDKCYENREWPWGYRENEAMGGYDPYSSSKGCAEILTASYRRSYFAPEEYGKKHQTLLASGRAGNVIGGGDWAYDRIIPDIARATFSGNKVQIRNPNAIRPWQHVIEPISGYLALATKLLNGETQYADGFNFGPAESNCVPVQTLIEGLQTSWSNLGVEVVPSDLHEAHFLKLDSSKARQMLKWQGRLSLSETLKWTADWYQAHYKDSKILTDEQISSYEKRMESH